MRRLGLDGRGGAVRIGPVHYNTIGEVDRVLAAVGRLADRRVLPVSAVGVVPA
jgi:selenocysteine lyase/cysteine desulfurase